MDGVRNKINVDKLRTGTTTQTYPNIVIEDLHPAIVPVVGVLDDGDYNLIACMNGESKVVKKISLGVTNIKRLLPFCKITVNFTKEDKYSVDNIRNYMEELEKWI